MPPKKTGDIQRILDLQRLPGLRMAQDRQFAATLVLVPVVFPL
jgi:hypothetical protein